MSHGDTFVSSGIGLLAVVVKRAGRRRPGNAGNRAKILVNRTNFTLSHVLKSGPNHDLKKIAIERWRNAALVDDSVRAGRMQMIQVDTGLQNLTKFSEGTPTFRPARFVRR